MPQNNDALSQRVNDNIESIVSFHQREQERSSPAERWLERIGALTGRPLYLLALLVTAAVWVSVNALAPLFRLHPFDPEPYARLHVLMTFAALASATIVLFTQQRQARLESQRAHLDLQVNLLTEQKVTKVIHLNEELRRDLPMVPDRHDAEATDLQRATDTAQVLSAIGEIGIHGSDVPQPDNTRST